MKTYAALNHDDVVVCLFWEPFHPGPGLAQDILSSPQVSQIVAVGDAPCGLGWKWEGSLFSPPAE